MGNPAIDDSNLRVKNNEEVLQRAEAFQDSIDYEKIGFQAGLEIHAQIKSSRKLFCYCKPDLISPDETPDYTFERYFRPVMGEMGDFDEGMVVEFEKNYRVIYHTFGDNICTYEMDETPPFYPDFEAIKTGFFLAMYYNCQNLVDEVVFNRKQYLDGSITTGFQRTAVVGRDGWITVNGKKVRISNFNIEEDAARRVAFDDRTSRIVYFNLDRLSIPLVEIITDHRDCTNPHDLRELAFLLGLGLRACNKGVRGIGSIRQDVNLSIKGGNRAELKGIQDLNMIKKYVDREIQRQQALIKIKNELKRRGVKSGDFEHYYVDVAHIIPLTAYQTTRRVENQIEMAIRLPKCKNLLNEIVQPGRTFAAEVFDKAELISGLSHEYMINGDAPPEWMDEPCILKLRKALHLEKNDTFALLIGPHDLVIHALRKIVERMKLALDGVPLETRRVLENGNNEFLRVIHGKDRLYPDTDTEPIPIPQEILEEIKKAPKPTPPWERIMNEGLSLDEARFIYRKKILHDIYIILRENHQITPRKAISILQKIQILKKLGLSYDTLSLLFHKLLTELSRDQLGRIEIIHFILEMQKGRPLKEIIAGWRERMALNSEIKGEVRNLIDEWRSNASNILENERETQKFIKQAMVKLKERFIYNSALNLAHVLIEELNQVV